MVTRGQLLEAGLGERAVDYRLRSGRLQHVHAGVYALGHVPVSPLTRALAAVLACGPSAVLSHRSAAALWELVPAWEGPIEVTVTSLRVRAGVISYRRRLEAGERTRQLGIPVTRPLRTLLDLACVLDDRTLARAVNEAQVKRLVRPDALAARLALPSARRARSRLRALLPPGAPTRSALEDAFLAFVDEHALPRPRTNASVGGYEVDMLWPSQRLIVELDGRAFHDTAQAFERDRERDAELMSLGFTVIRLTWARLRGQPRREAARLRRLLRC